MVNFIIGGGIADENFIKQTIENYDRKQITITACDRGYVVCKSLGLKPDFIIGDFDSSPEGTYEQALEEGCPLVRLNPIKDDSDSEAAINLVIENTTEGDIVFLAGTGTRLDHVLGNIALLGMALKKGRRVILLDKTNRIQMLTSGQSLTIKKGAQHGKYISLMPYMGPVKGLTLEGFKYSLNNHDIFGFSTLTVSNEISENEGTIRFAEGYLIVMETMD